MRDACTADRKAEVLDGLHGEVLDDVRRLREVQVRLGRGLLALRRAPSLYRFGATTFSLYCETVGLSAQEGRDFASLAEAAETRPEVEGRFAEGRLSVGKVAVLAEVLRHPELRDPGEDWVRIAERVTTRDLWRLLRERREARRLAESPVSLVLFVSRQGREDFRRCRELEGRRAGTWVTEGETLERACDTYLDRFDVVRKAARLASADREAEGAAAAGRAREAAQGKAEEAAREEAGGTARRRGSQGRRIPEATVRALIRLHGDCCWVDGCDGRSFLDFAHRVPFRHGGGQDEENLLRLCKEHHAQFDGAGWRPVVRHDGGVVLVDRRGVVVGRLRSGTSVPPATAPR